MTLLLVRHGQTDWNREPARCQGWAEMELNEVGRGQARDLGRALKGRGVELVVTSHLVRARETAELIHEELGGELPFVVDPRLAEAHRGEWETRRFSSIMREEPDDVAAVPRAPRDLPLSRRREPGDPAAPRPRLPARLRSGRPPGAAGDARREHPPRALLPGGTRHRRLPHDQDANGGVDEIEVDGLARRIDAYLGGKS